MYDKSYSKSQTSPLSNYTEEKSNELDANHFSKGEMVGRFEMGSTIVLIWESPINTRVHVLEGQKLVLGQKLVTTSY